MILLPPISSHFPYTTLFRSVELVIDLQGGMDFILMKQVKLYPQVAAFGFRQCPSRVLLEKLRAVIAFLDEHATVFEYLVAVARGDRKSTRLNSSHVKISYAV